MFRSSLRFGFHGLLCGFCSKQVSNWVMVSPNSVKECFEVLLSQLAGRTFVLRVRVVADATSRDHSGCRMV